MRLDATGCRRDKLYLRDSRSKERHDLNEAMNGLARTEKSASCMRSYDRLVCIVCLLVYVVSVVSAPACIVRGDRTLGR